MRWRGLLLALALLLLPSPAHASGEGEKPTTVDEDVPDLPPDDLEAWKYYSIRAKKLHHSGLALMIAAPVVLVPGIVLISLDLRPHDGGTPTAAYFAFTGIPFVCSAVILYGIGLGLIARGIVAGTVAGRIVSGELTLEDLAMTSADRTPMPFVSPFPGGMVAGVSGAF